MLLWQLLVRSPPPSEGGVLGEQRRCSLVKLESLEVMAQHSFGLEGLAAAAGVRPLTGVVQLVNAQH